MARCCLVFTSRRWVDGDPVSMPSPSHNHIPHHPLAQRPAISTTLSALIIQHNNKPSTTMSTAPGEWQKHFCACCCGGTCSSCVSDPLQHHLFSFALTDRPACHPLLPLLHARKELRAPRRIPRRSPRPRQDFQRTLPGVLSDGHHIGTTKIHSHHDAKKRCKR